MLYMIYSVVDHTLSRLWQFVTFHFAGRVFDTPREDYYASSNNDHTARAG